MPPNTKKCCEKPKRTTSVSTRKGRRSICNNCGADWVFEAVPLPKKCGHEGNYSACWCGTYSSLLESVTPTPAVEDWTKELYRGLCKDCDSDTPHEIVECTRHTKGLSPIWVDGFIRSLRESDRKRIVGEIEAKITDKVEDILKKWITPEVKFALFDLLTFITNLK